MFEIGATLREARQRQGLDLTQVERALKIRARQLHALEEERFDALPGDAYTRSFLRSYADFLGLDWQLYLAEYDSRFRRGDEELSPVPVRAHRPRRRLGGPRTLVVALVLAVALVVGLAAWSQLNGKKTATPPPAQAKAPPKAPAAARKPVRPRPVVHRVVPKAKPKPKPKPRVAGEIVLTTANGPCWVLVRRGSETGPQLYLGTVAAGKTISFRGKRLWLRLGAPSAVRTRVNGKPLRLPANGAPVNVLLTASGARVL